MEVNNDISIDRMRKAILIVLMEVYPIGLNPSEILDRIEERDLLHMSEERFKEYENNILQMHKN